MTSCQRRGSGPVRQHSLQQMSRRHHHHHHHHHLHHHPHHHLTNQMRRQRSAEEDRSYGIGGDKDGEERERPREVRIAWGGDEQGHGPVASGESNNSRGEEGRVEVVACQIVTGKSRALPNSRQPRIINRSTNNNNNNNNNNNGNNNNLSKNGGSTLLYSRQELAERLRLAWKQREANKSNIDVFLAQGTTEERSDSRLSNSSSPDRSPARISDRPVITEEKKVPDKVTDKIVEKRMEKTRPEKIISPGSSVEAAKSRRASFRSGTNAAFSQPVVETTDAATADIGQTRKDIPMPIATVDSKNRRTNSAPPHRRANSVGPSSTKTQVNIVIEAPRILKPEVEANNAGNNSTEETRLNGSVARPIKSAPAKRRTKNAKKRANSLAGKESESGRQKIGNSEAKNGEVITMVSLVSDADSDTEIEDNSPRDDKLISQLRSNLPTTPIIKSNVSTCCSLNSIARRPIKSVSFQQDSIDVEDDSDKTRILRIRPQSVQVGRVTGSALPTAEEAKTWRSDVTSLTVASVTTARHHYEVQEITEISLTDREKRCLIVPIGDLRSDKKRKLLRTKSTPQPRIDDIDKSPSMQATREAPTKTRIPENIEKCLPVHQPTSILLQAAVSKLSNSVVISRTETVGDPDDESTEEPAFQTTKEKECWHLYRRMCDKGVCVSFDTVLRGMLTPTEYRLRRKEMT